MIKFRKTAIYGAMIVSVLASNILAQSRRLTAEFHPTPVRSGAPSSVECTLNYHGLGLLEGDMILRVTNGRQQLTRLTIEDIVLASGEQRFRLMLPAVVSSSPFQQLELRAEFVGKQARSNLGSKLFRTPTSYRRTFVNCICSSWQRSTSPDRIKLVNGLRMEQFNPTDDDLTISTVPTHILPDDMPSDPLWYCCFDLVLLRNEGFRGLREKQLRAIHDWVDAGGSLCVVADGSLAPFHVKLLNELLASRGDGKPHFTQDASGDLVTLENNALPTDIWLARKGLGRVAVVHKKPAAANEMLESATWRQTVAFLWKIRRDQDVVSSGKWKHRDPEGLQDQNRFSDFEQRSQRMTWQPIQSISGLLNELMPRDVQVVPLGLIGLLLFLYVLVIGPVDYFGLGAIKQRKLTWILFPAVTIGFTMFTVWMAHAYMSSDENRKAVVFLDVAAGGKDVRKNRLELLFTGTPQTMTTSVQKGIFTPLNHERFGGFTYRNPYENLEGLAGQTEYRGRIPLRYSAIQKMPQWTPQLNRLLTISPENLSFDFDWDSAQEIGTPQGRRDLTKRVLESFGRDANVYLFNKNQQLTLAQNRQVFNPMTDDSLINFGYESSRFGFLKDVCVRPQYGMFGVVSQVSPSGGNHFEDFAILDPSDQGQWLLVIVIEREGEIQIYRKLYYLGGNTSAN